MSWNYYPGNELRFYGVSCDLVGLPEVVDRRGRNVASCDSSVCSKSGQKIWKRSVKGDETFCPDCGSALYWSVTYRVLVGSAGSIPLEDEAAGSQLQEEAALRDP